jgi:CBS domain-containing protein
MAQTIKDVMTHDPIMLPEDTPVTEAATAMRESDIGDVIVLDQTDQVCGMVTDRDVTVRVVAEGRDPSKTRLGEICSRNLASVAPDDSVGDALKVMSEKAIRRLPVIDAGRPVGIVSIGDLAMDHDPDSALADISAAPPNR